MGQSTSAAERSAHVERGPARRYPGEDFLVEVEPGIYRLKAVVLAERERDRMREALRKIAGTRWDMGAADACIVMIQTDARAALAEAAP